MTTAARIRLAQTPTPLQPLDRLSAELGGPRLWIKRDDLTGSVCSGNKIRKLEFSLAQALAEGADTIITCGGLQSNHCRSTALLCSQLGLRCHLVLRGEASGTPDGNLLLDCLAGAEIDCIPPRRYQAELEQLLQDCAERYAADGHHAFIIPTGASDAIGVWGYVEGARELAEDCRREGFIPDAVVHATGSGGTQAGLTAGMVMAGLATPVYGVAVCDDEAWFMNKVRQDLRDWQQRYQPSIQRVGKKQPLDVEQLTINVIDGYVGPGYAQAGPEVFDCISRLARAEGIVLDPVYTGKGFYAMLDSIKRGTLSGDNIVFVHTGGVFGVFPQREEFGFSF